MADAFSRKTHVKGICCFQLVDDLRNRIREAQYSSVNEGNLYNEMKCGAKDQLMTKSDDTKMSGGNGDDTVALITEQIKEKIFEEVGKALENSLPGFMESLRDWPTQGQAKDWWDNHKKEQGIEVTRNMTWEEFKVPFLKHHSPKRVINKIKEEFIQLRQKGETIHKIMGIFLDKLRFCDELVQTKEQKIYYYYNMLSEEYREFMIPSKYETLMEIINIPREHEIELRKQVERGKRRVLDANPSPTKKLKMSESSKKMNVKRGSPNCKTCGRAHRGECYFKDKPCVICGKMGHAASICPDKVSVCYKCYQPGHKKSECPKLVGKKEAPDTKTKVPRSKARSFHITAAEAKVEPDVVLGTFTVNSIPA
ncbi:uncharacterized protein LOC110913944 [Helianthus annuus]|uniref:uncharacterized protein LOC110913944 n=1 Tax=Helianthus annuus TaxID=4232 RepID=UPI000B8F9908|nr:uncharacterized protein LOC110913944 [Helianthus annuus]